MRHNYYAVIIEYQNQDGFSALRGYVASEEEVQTKKLTDGMCHHLPTSTISVIGADSLNEAKQIVADETTPLPF